MILNSSYVNDRIAELQGKVLTGIGMSHNENYELAALERLREECDWHEDWWRGVELISDDAFPWYTKNLVETLGLMPLGAKWLQDSISWYQAADNLKVALEGESRLYRSVRYHGRTFWMSVKPTPEALASKLKLHPF